MRRRNFSLDGRRGVREKARKPPRKRLNTRKGYKLSEKKRVFRTTEQKLYIVRAIDEAIAKGSTIVDAAKEQGIREQQYREWKRGKQKRMNVVPAKTVHHTFPIVDAKLPHRTGMISIKGTPEDIGVFLRVVAQGVNP